MFYERCPCRCLIPCFVCVPPGCVLFWLSFPWLFLFFSHFLWAFCGPSSVHVPENRIYLIRTVNFQHLELNRRTFSAGPIGFPLFRPLSQSVCLSLRPPHMTLIIHFAQSIWPNRLGCYSGASRNFSSVLSVDVHYF